MLWVAVPGRGERPPGAVPGRPGRWAEPTECPIPTRVGVVGGWRLYREAVIAALRAEPDLAPLTIGDDVPDESGDVVIALVDRDDEAGPVTAAHVLRVRMAGPAAEGGIGGEQSLGDILLAARALVQRPGRVLSLDGPGQGGRRRALTSRELDVLRLIGTGHTAEEIAVELHTTVGGVENTKRRIFEKLGVQTQTHAVADALRQGLLSAPRSRRPGRPST